MAISNFCSKCGACLPANNTCERCTDQELTDKQPLSFFGFVIFVSDAIVVISVLMFVYGFFIEPSFLGVIAIWIFLPFALFSAAGRAVRVARGKDE